MSLFEEFSLFPGAFLKGSHTSLNLRNILDVYSQQEYELAGGGRLPEQRPKGPAGTTAPGSSAPQYIPGKVLEQTKSILSRGDNVDELRAYLENAKPKMPGKFKNSVQNILILAARQARLKCAVMLLDDYGADVNSSSSFKKHSSLHFAAYNGDKALAKELLSRGASKTLLNIYKETPAKTAENQMDNNSGDEIKQKKFQETLELITNFTMASARSGGLETMSTYIPTSQSNAIVDTYQDVSRKSVEILNKVTDDNEVKMFKRLKDLVPISGFNRPDRHEKFEIRHFKLLVENLWKTAIAQPSMAGLYASLADKLHTHFSSVSKDMVRAMPTNTGKFYRMVFDEKLMTPLYDSERTALSEAGKCVNFKRELLMQCQRQFNSERDLARFRRAIDWDSITDEIERKRKENDVMYDRNKAQDRMTANVVFIGQLYNHGLATTSIIRMCVDDLMPPSRTAPDSVLNSEDKEALNDYVDGLENDTMMLVKLIEVVGQKFEKPAPRSVAPGASSVAIAAFDKAKRDSDRRRKMLAKWFKTMRKVSDTQKTGAPGEITLPIRVRFAVQDLVELRQRGWVTRNLAESKGKKSTTDDDGWTSVPGGSLTASTAIAAASPGKGRSKKNNKAAKAKEKARLAAEAKAAEEAARRKEINKEAQKLADSLRSLDNESERIRVQIDKHMSGPKQARARKAAKLQLKKNKQERNKIKSALKIARAKGPDAEEPETKVEVPKDIIMPDDDDDFFELPPLENEAKVKGMLKEFLETTRDFEEFSRSLGEMKLPSDEAYGAVVFFLLVYACETLSSSTKRKQLLDLIELLKHLLKNNDVSKAQLDLAIKAFNCIIDDIKMDAPLAGKVYDEVKSSIGVA